MNDSVVCYFIISDILKEIWVFNVGFGYEYVLFM